MADFLNQEIAVNERESNAIAAKLDALRKGSGAQLDVDPAARTRIDELAKIMREAARRRELLMERLAWT